MSESVVGLGDREDNLTLLFLSNLSEDGFSSSGGFVVVGEEEQSGVTLLENFLDGSVVEGHNEGEGVFVNESL